MVDLEQAVVWLNEGKMIRRKSWDKGFYFRRGGIPDMTVKSSFEEYYVGTDDWEIYPIEKKKE